MGLVRGWRHGQASGCVEVSGFKRKEVEKLTQAASSADAAYATEVVGKLTTLSAANLKVSTEKVGDKEVVALEVDGAAFRDDDSEYKSR